MEEENSDVNIGASVDGLDLVGEGQIISHDCNSIEFNIADLTLNISFEFDGSETRMETELVSDKVLQFTLYNHGGNVITGGNSSPVGPEDPILLGIVDNREILLSYRTEIEYVDDNPSTVKFSYNFYLGEETEEPTQEGENEEK